MGPQRLGAEPGRAVPGGGGLAKEGAEQGRGVDEGRGAWDRAETGRIRPDEKSKPEGDV